MSSTGPFETNPPSPETNSSTPLPIRPLLTVNDINGLYTTDNPPIYNVYGHIIDDQPKYNIDGGAAVHTKIQDVFPPNHQIDCAKYTRVFFTSDIHSDLRKFVQMLKNNELIDTELDPYTDDIYNPELIADSKWTGGSRTLLVIIGDLVDGRRSSETPTGELVYNEVEDPKGSFELLLFCLIYNLRVKANEVGSEVLFNIGNHEHMTVITLPPDSTRGTVYEKYVAVSAQKFFGTKFVRQNALLPFLYTSPYYILGFYNGGRPEMASVHGGLHSYIEKKPIDNTEALVAFQQLIDKGTSFLEDIPPILNDSRAKEGGPIWSRAYNEVDPEGAGFCNNLGSTTFPFIVVGHCPTDSNKRTKHLITNNKKTYAGCDIEDIDIPNPVGCIVTDCDHGSGPRLAFVDAAMSKAFRKPTVYWNQTTGHVTQEDKSRVAGYTLYTPPPNKDRPVQMLLLRHDPRLDDTRYFNKIHRVSGVATTGLPNRSGDTLLYEAGVSSPGVFSSPPYRSPPYRNISPGRSNNGFFSRVRSLWPFSRSGGTRRRKQIRNRNRKQKTKKQCKNRK